MKQMAKHLSWPWLLQRSTQPGSSNSGRLFLTVSEAKSKIRALTGHMLVRELFLVHDQYLVAFFHLTKDLCGSFL